MVVASVNELTEPPVVESVPTPTANVPALTPTETVPAGVCDANAVEKATEPPVVPPVPVTILKAESSNPAVVTCVQPVGAAAW